MAEAVKSIKVRKWSPVARLRHGRAGQAVVRRWLRRRADTVLRRMDKLADVDDQALRQRALAVYTDRERIGRDGRAELETIALIGEAIRRETGLTLHPNQVMAALAMNRGWMIELATGEGKTLAVLATAAAFALMRRPVHVITANAYLAGRDAELADLVIRRVGLTATVLSKDKEGLERKQAYRDHVMYTTLHEVGFDWLRDRLSMLRGSTDRIQQRLRVAIVDEADLVMIDEARTPMILSQQIEDDKTQLYQWAHREARKLKPGEDYQIVGQQSVELSDKAYRRLIRRFPEDKAPEAELALLSMLKAYLFYRRNVQYAIDPEEDKVVIVDERTGRLMPGRQWPHGLHEAVTIKEGLPLDKPTAHMAQITVQQFLAQYDEFAGCSGTMFGAAREIWAVYGHPTVRVPTHRPCIRRHDGQDTFATRSEQFDAAVERIRELHEAGRPVLVGTTHITHSYRVSQLLERHGIEHQVLTALDEAEEARIVAQAGEPHAVTIATNMAGRGTDIKLGERIADRGGLHVLSLQRHESSRVDRQLIGRCARQGDPGSCEFLLSLQDPLLETHARKERAGLRRRRRGRGRPLPHGTVDRLWNRVQRQVEREHRETRVTLLTRQVRIDELIGKPDYLSDAAPLDRIARPWL